MAQGPQRKNLLRRILCVLGKHKRDAAAARKRQGVWYTRCAGCDIDMLKRDDGAGWIVLDPPPKRRRSRKSRRPSV